MLNFGLLYFSPIDPAPHNPEKGPESPIWDKYSKNLCCRDSEAACTETHLWQISLVKFSLVVITPYLCTFCVQIFVHFIFLNCTTAVWIPSMTSSGKCMGRWCQYFWICKSCLEQESCNITDKPCRVGWKRVRSMRPTHCLAVLSIGYPTCPRHTPWNAG